MRRFVPTPAYWIDSEPLDYNIWARVFHGRGYTFQWLHDVSRDIFRFRVLRWIPNLCRVILVLWIKIGTSFLFESENIRSTLEILLLKWIFSWKCKHIWKVFTSCPCNTLCTTRKHGEIMQIRSTLTGMNATADNPQIYSVHYLNRQEITPNHLPYWIEI